MTSGWGAEVQNKMITRRNGARTDPMMGVQDGGLQRQIYLEADRGHSPASTPRGRSGREAPLDGAAEEWAWAGEPGFL